MALEAMVGELEAEVETTRREWLEITCMVFVVFVVVIVGDVVINRPPIVTEVTRGGRGPMLTELLVVMTLVAFETVEITFVVEAEDAAVARGFRAIIFLPPGPVMTMSCLPVAWREAANAGGTMICLNTGFLSSPCLICPGSIKLAGEI